MVVLCSLAALAAPGLARAADRLPDLGMARLTDLKAEKTADGRRLLRFTTVIVNVGSGPFEVRGTRAGLSEAEMATSQRIYDSTGGFREVATGARMFFAGDGHDHWHVRDLESFELIRLDNGVKVGTGAKVGFCFFDNVAYRLALPGAPAAAAYPGCGNASSLGVTMGISVGWGDEYSWRLPNQYVDITGLGAGRYRLRVTADAPGYFVEANEANNATWVDLQIKGRGAPRVIAYGPAV
ncbi:MAG: lysyl oxidase family protein [Gaiellaceae bacterium]